MWYSFNLSQRLYTLDHIKLCGQRARTLQIGEDIVLDWLADRAEHFLANGISLMAATITGESLINPQMIIVQLMSWVSMGLLVSIKLRVSGMYAQTSNEQRRV